MKLRFVFLILGLINIDFCYAQQWINLKGTKSIDNYLLNISNENLNKKLIPYPKIFSSVTQINENIYFIGGDNYLNNYKDSLGRGIFKYNLIENKFDFFDTISKYNLINSRLGVISFTLGNEIFYFGGIGKNEKGKIDYSNDLCKYNIEKKNWDNLNSLALSSEQKIDFIPSPRSNPNYWIQNDKLYLLGGIGMKNHIIVYLNDFWEYSIKQNTWKKLLNYNQSTFVNDFPINATNAQTWTYGNKLYFYSGKSLLINNTINSNSNLYIYDIESNKWSKVLNKDFESSIYQQNNPLSREGACIWQNENKIFLFGGNGYDQFGKYGRLNDLWSFDCDNYQWENLDPKKIYQINQPVFVDNEINPGSRIFAIPFKYQNRFFLYGGFGNNKSISGTFNDIWEWKLIKKDTSIEKISIVQQSKNNTNYLSQQITQINTPQTEEGNKFELKITLYPTYIDNNSAKIISNYPLENLKYIIRSNFKGIVTKFGEIPYISESTPFGLDFTNQLPGLYSIEILGNTFKTIIQFQIK